MRFKINTFSVIHQTLDGEVIVVDLDSGTYYSGEQAGSRTRERFTRAVSRLGEGGS